MYKDIQDLLKQLYSDYILLFEIAIFASFLIEEVGEKLLSNRFNKQLNDFKLKYSKNENEKKIINKIDTSKIFKIDKDIINISFCCSIAITVFADINRIYSVFKQVQGTIEELAAIFFVYILILLAIEYYIFFKLKIKIAYNRIRITQ